MSGTGIRVGDSPNPEEKLRKELAQIAELTKIRLPTLLQFDWSVDIDKAIGDPNLPPAQLNAFATHCLYRYITSSYYDYDLFAEFIDDFRNYNSETFSKINTVVLREIKRALRYGGIYTGKPTANVASALAETVKQEDLSEWPDCRDTNLVALNPLCEAYKERHQRQSGQAVQTSPERASEEVSVPLSPEQHEQRADPNSERPKVRTISPSLPALPPQSPLEQTEMQPRFGTDQPRVNDYDVLPPREFHNGVVALDKLTGFIKLYNKDQHYTGQAYDVLDTKVRLMFRTCKACGIDPSGFKVVFEKIMSGSAFDFWIRHIKEEDTFRTAYMKIRLHFDTVVNRQRYYNDWTSSTLTTVKSDSDNAGKTPREILHTLFTTLTKAQKALGPPWDTDEQLQAAVIKACRGSQELEMALSVPKPNAEELMQQITVALDTALARQPEQSFTYVADAPEAMYTDRRYYRPFQQAQRVPRLPFRYRGASRGRFQTPFQRGNHRGRGGRRDFPQRSNPAASVKTCIVCGKQGCWSTNHPAQRDVIKRQYFNSLQLDESDEEGWDDENDNFEAWVVDTEGVDTGVEEIEEDNNAPESQNDETKQFYASMPQNKHPPGTIIRIVKPLYGIAESGVHWFATYQPHLCKQLHMRPSSYDPCLLITTSDALGFGIVGMQTDDTLMLCDLSFQREEDTQLCAAKLKAKPTAILTRDNNLDFNGCKITCTDETLHLVQKGQSALLKVVRYGNPDQGNEYRSQRARAAWIATMSQLEASFQLSVAVQSQQSPTEEDFKKLNACLQWQIQNAERGLKYIPLNLSTLRLYVFTDGSLANTADLSSQIGFVIALGNEESHGDTFMLRANLIHWSSTKCKRVTRSILASEIYGMVAGFDISITLKATLNTIASELSLPQIPLIVCTDSLSLYECLVKLGTTAEKRLMIDIMALRQSYERREISETRWIHGDDNPADAMTKAKPNSALAKLVDRNELSIRIKGEVTRPRL